MPPGFYWIDSIDAESYSDADVVKSLRETYDTMLKNVFPGAAETIRTTHHDATTLPVRAPARDWILFEVTRPVPRWPVGARWGLPTVAPRGANTQEGDTVQKPPPEKRGFDFELGGTSIKTYFYVGGAVLGGLLLYKAVS